MGTRGLNVQLAIEKTFFIYSDYFLKKNLKALNCFNNTSSGIRTIATKDNFHFLYV